MTDIVERLKYAIAAVKGIGINSPLLTTALAEIERLRAASEWRDISTAPRDKCIVLCVEGYQPSIGRWWPKDKCWTSFDWEGHFESDAEVTQYVRGCQYEPTHWRPLPAPPQRNEVTKPNLEEPT